MRRTVPGGSRCLVTDGSLVKPRSSCHWLAYIAYDHAAPESAATAGSPMISGVPADDRGVAADPLQLVGQHPAGRCLVEPGRRAEGTGGDRLPVSGQAVGIRQEEGRPGLGAGQSRPGYPERGGGEPPVPVELEVRPQAVERQDRVAGGQALYLERRV